MLPSLLPDLPILTLENVVVFIFCEAIGAPFCYAAAQEILDGKYASGIVGFFIGLPFSITGFTWHWLKPWIQKGLSSVNRIVSANHLMLALLVLFIYVAGPSFLQRLMFAWSSTRSSAEKPGKIAGHVNDFDTGEVVSDLPKSKSQTQEATAPAPLPTPPALADQGLAFTMTSADQMKDDFLRLPRPCVMKILAPPELQNARSQLVSRAMNSFVYSMNGGYIIPTVHYSR